MVAQDKVLEREVFAGTTEINQDAKQHREEAQHRRGSISGQARRGLDDPRSTFAALQPAILRQSQPGLCIRSPDQSTVQSASSTTLPSGSETNTDRLP